jgi:hypothetical protein
MAQEASLHISICLVWLAKYEVWVNTAKHLISKREDMHHFIIKIILLEEEKSINI